MRARMASRNRRGFDRVLGDGGAGDDLRSAGGECGLDLDLVEAALERRDLSAQRSPTRLQARSESVPLGRGRVVDPGIDAVELALDLGDLVTKFASGAQ